MKNKEKFKDKIFEIACTGDSLAVKKETMELVCCHTIQCSECLFGGNSACYIDIGDWLKADYQEPLSAESVYNKFEDVCQGESCRFCEYKHINKASKCAIQFVFDNYNVTKKETNEDDN